MFNYFMIFVNFRKPFFISSENQNIDLVCNIKIGSRIYKKTVIVFCQKRMKVFIKTANFNTLSLDQ